MTVEEARDKVADLMKWKREDVDKFSLPFLRDLVRGKDERLHREIARIIDAGEHIFTKVPIKRRF